MHKSDNIKKDKKVIYPYLITTKSIWKNPKILKRKNIQVESLKNTKKPKIFIKVTILKNKVLATFGRRIAISKDLFTIDKKNKNITNFQSRTLSQYFRTKLFTFTNNIKNT